MRKGNEQLIATYTVAVYADKDKLNDPSGSGANPSEFAQEVTSGLTEQIQEHTQEQLQAQFSNWDSKDLRCEVIPIS